MMRSGNPALSEKTFTRYAAAEAEEAAAAPGVGVMTLQGTVNRTAVLLGIVIVTAALAWRLIGTNPQLAIGLMIGGIAGGLIAAIITIVKKEWAPITAPIYVVLEGLFLGAISCLMETVYPGIVGQAVGLTFGVFLLMLAIYKFRIIKVTENFKMGVIAATGAIFMVYLVTLILRLFGVGVPFIHDSGWIGILFSLFVVVIASLNLVLDFDFVEKGATVGAPRYMEWYAAFGLMVTLIWLYIEILRLLAKLNRR